MIRNIGLNGFKCFSTYTSISLSQITICTGMNSVGKSTLIQALLLMWQSYEKLKSNKDEILRVLLNTSALKLGSSDQIMLSSKMTLEANDEHFKYYAETDKLSLNFRKEDEVSSSIFDTMLYYLNAERLGPRNYQEMKSHDTLHCGYHGEYTFDVVQKNPLVEISRKRCFNYGAFADWLYDQSDGETRDIKREIQILINQSETISSGNELETLISYSIW